MKVIRDRYELVEVVGEGAHARTWQAHDRQRDLVVAVKELPVSRLREWKHLERFKREAEMLATLTHRGIPRLYNHFVEEEEQGTTYFIVEEWIDGPTLLEEVETDGAVGERAARDLLRDALDILGYLHSQEPPVVHRDIKPSNIMRRADGRLVLVDFGAVREAADTGEEGTTVVGTFGYMPPEQLHGKVEPASDYFALAATTCHMLCGKSPKAMPIKGEPFGIDFRKHARLSPALADMLDAMLNPDADARLTDVRQASRMLDEVEDEPLPDEPVDGLHLVGEDAPKAIAAPVAGPHPITRDHLMYAVGLPPLWRWLVGALGLLLLWTGIPGVLVLLAGVGTGLWNLREAYGNYELLADGTQVPARITSIEDRYGGYLVEYAYSWAGGRYEAEIPLSRKRAQDLEVGQWIQVAIDPNNPTESVPMLAS